MTTGTRGMNRFANQAGRLAFAKHCLKDFHSSWDLYLDPGLGPA